jgi:undecaprenyl-diphosphatase
MDIIQAIIIAIVEGLTEFLPVSSTAHMKFTNPLIGVTPTPFTNMFEIVIQLAAILSVVFAYSKKFFDFKHPSFYIKLIVAVIPALIAGVLLKKYIDRALDNLTFIACVMIAGGIIYSLSTIFLQGIQLLKKKTFPFQKPLLLDVSRCCRYFFQDLAVALQPL